MPKSDESRANPVVTAEPPRGFSVAGVATGSIGAFFSVIFPPSRKATFPEAMEFCERALIFETGDILGRKQYHAAFSDSDEQIALAHGAMRALQGVAGLRIFCRGIEFTGHSINFYAVLDCYVTSRKCIDYRAHCHRIVSIDRWDDELESEDFVFPCSYLSRYGGAMDIDTRHPSSALDQIQAKAVARGCDWCPRLQISAFRSIDSNVIDI